ncbi:MAG: WYL domain-containing transcriptional regulator [Bryobacterales bacterium]|nr:WYL domain-containing transcriptional regulator [Bryobacterales bacterium]
MQDLARRFQTRRETIYRDLHALEEAGYPIGGDENGLLSRPRLLNHRGTSHPEIRFNLRELDALLWVLAHSETAKAPFRDQLSSAAEKLRALRSLQHCSPADAADEVVSVLHRGARDYSRHSAAILSLMEGILRERRTRICYRSPSRPEPHDFDYDPYRLLTVPDGLYCLGQTPAHGGLTTLALDRIDSVTLLDESFKVDTVFDPARIEQDAFGVVWENPITVVVRFSANQTPYVKERLWHPSQSFRDLANGSVEMTFRAAGEFEITRWILSWGDAAEVLAPDSTPPTDPRHPRPRRRPVLRRGLGGPGIESVAGQSEFPSDSRPTMPA